MVMRRTAIALATLGLGGCTLITDSFLTNDFSGDEFPIAVDTSTGAIVVGMREGTTDHVAVLDLMSPITIADPGVTTPPSVAFTDLTVLGRGSDGTLDLPRARLVEAQLVSVHPCVTACDASSPVDCDPAQCIVGAPGQALAFTGVIGADALAGDAVRLRLDSNQLFILPDIGGSDRGRSLSCESVFDSPYRGGGTLVLGGTELPFGNRRITLQACLGYAVAPPLPEAPDFGYAMQLRARGTDAVLVASTGIGVSLLGESAYARYRLADPSAAALDQLAAATRYLPSGPITGRLAHINRLALIASSTSNSVGPCRQVHAHHLLSAYVPRSTDECADRGELSRETTATPVPAIDCPCDDGSRFCDVPAVLELDPALAAVPGAIDFLIVSDDDRTLQALRTELRPDQPEVDGVLGIGALRAAEIDVDYPHDRLIARCRGPGCSARPELAAEGDRCQINHCIHGLTTNVGCP